MKIIFICGSVEPGQDGVGDYTRRLAGELIFKGHKAGIIAINEKHISAKIYCLQMFAGCEIPVLRLPSSLSYKERFRIAGLWIKEQNPEWLSLQFVPYAFNQKGMPFGIANALAGIGKGRLWHIMFHELWIGMEINSSWKNYLFGMVQKNLIQSIITKLNPRAIHTQSKLYFSLLKALGYNAKYLALFGNIPFYRRKCEVSKNQSPGIKDTHPKSFILFGGIHVEAPVDHFAKDAALYCLENDVQIMLTIIGRCGKEQERWSSIWSLEGLPVQVLGEQPTERVSEEMQKASWGLATTPVALIDKSGSVAAMLEHGLPVVCVSRNWKPRHNMQGQLPSGVVEYKSNIGEIFSLKKEEANTSNAFSITQQFINDLSLTV